MSEQVTHPSREELNVYSLGELTEDKAVAIDSHISECRPCCETIVDLSSDDTFLELLKEAKQIPTDQTVEQSGPPVKPSSLDVPASLAEHPRYEIVGLIGKGGMGDVYKATHRMMDRTVALKIIKRELMQNSAAVDRFHREVKAAAKLSHPNIVTSHDAEQVGDVHFMAMEYVDGFDLSQIIKDLGALPIAEACDYVRQAAIGLQHAHEQGMVHRDIKPHNLMVTDVEARHTVKILDFGLASLAPVTSPDADTVEAHGDLTAAGAIMGTPDFIAPEQADDARQADIRSDIYSLGTTLYFLLSGRPPFVEGSVIDKLKSHAEVEPEPLESLRDDIPADLAAIVSKMIAKDPASRFQTPEEAVAAMDSFARARQEETPEQLPKPQVKPRRQRSRSLKLTAVATMFFAAIVAAVVYYIQTNNGTVRIEVIDPLLEVSINGRTIRMNDGKKELEIGVGEQKLAVRLVGSDFKFETDSFQISRNGLIAFKVDRLEGKVVVSKDGVRFKSETLPNDVKPPAGESETADEIVRRLSEIHGHLTPKLQTMLSEAAGIPNGQWSNFQRDPSGAVDAIKGEPLSFVLWRLNPLQESTTNLKVLEGFQYVGGVPKPKQLSDAMSPSRVHGYHSMLQPEYISGLTYDMKAGPLNSATLKGNFRYQAPKLYAGKINFVVHVNADTDLQVTEFTLPNYGITIVRGEDGMWKRGRSLGNDNKGTNSAKKIFATALVNGCEVSGSFTKEQGEITVKNPTGEAKDVTFYYQIVSQNSRDRDDIFQLKGGFFKETVPAGRQTVKRVDLLLDPNASRPFDYVKDTVVIRISRERAKELADVPVRPSKKLDIANAPVAIASQPTPGHSAAPTKPVIPGIERFVPGKKTAVPRVLDASPSPASEKSPASENLPDVPVPPSTDDPKNAKKTAESITLANVNRVGLLAEPKRAARYIKLGPGPNELLLYPPNGIVVVNDKSLNVLRKLDKEQTRGFSFSRDRSLTSWTKGKTAMIRDEKTGKTLEIDAGQRPGAAAFSPDNKVVAIGDMIITGSEGEGSSLLRVFDAKSGKLIRKMEISMKGYGGLSPVFSPDGKTLAVGNRNYETKLFDTETWNLRHTLPKKMTHEIAFSPDGKTLAAGYVDGTLALWDVDAGESLHMVESGCYRIHSIAWNPAGDLLATSGPAGSNHGPNNTWIKLPGKVLLWNAKTFKVAKELMEVQWSGSVRFTRDGARLMSTVRKKATLDDSPRIAIWSTNAPPMEQTTRAKVAVPTLPVAHSLSLPAVAAPTVALSPDGQRVVAPLKNDGQLAIWNMTTGEQEVVMNGQHSWQIWRVAFSPDGSTVATASLDKTAKLWDAKTGDLLATMEGHTDRLKYVTYSPAGKYVLTSTGKQWPYSKPGNVSARVWDAKTGKLISELKTHADTIRSATFSADEARVLTSSDDHTARLWEAASGKELHMFDHGSGIRTIAFSPNGKTVLTSSSGAQSHYVKEGSKSPKPSMKLWSVKTGKQLGHKPHLQAVTASFNESGDRILTECRGVITYWDAASGKKLTTLREPLIGTEVVFSPNGKYFVVVTPDEPLELWSISDQEPIARMVIDKPYRSFFSRDSRTFYSLTRAGQFRSWSLEGPAAIKESDK